MKTADIAILVIGIGLSSIVLQSYTNSTREKSSIRESYRTEKREAVVPSRLDEKYFEVYNKRR
jgi:hypothetical protein